MSSLVLVPAEQSYNTSIQSYFDTCSTVTTYEEGIRQTESEYKQTITEIECDCKQEIADAESEYKQSISGQQHQFNQAKQLLNVNHRDVTASKNAYKCALEAFIKDAYDTSFLGCCADLLCESKECESIDTATISCSTDTSCKKTRKHHHNRHRHHHKRDIKPQGTIKSAANTGCKSCK